MNARNTWRKRRIGSADGSVSFRAVALCSMLLAMSLGSGGCGASARTEGLVGSETHFLTRCDANCGGGLQCIAGVCTRPCTVSEADTCAELPGAECKADVGAGGSGVCDVACEVDEACRGLSPSHRCVDGACRAAEVVVRAIGGSESQVSSGLDDTCAAFRDRVSETETVVAITNDLSVPIYLQPAQNCTNVAPRLVTFDGPVLFPDERQVCGLLWCQEVQDSGYTAGPPCASDCFSPALVRLEPGAEIEVGRFHSETRSHGSAASGLPRMPDACYTLRDGDRYPNLECTSEVPMDGSYLVTAQAFTALDCNGDEEFCDCASAEGSCTTGVSSGSGALSASEAFESGTPRVEVVFR